MPMLFALFWLGFEGKTTQLKKKTPQNLKETNPAKTREKKKRPATIGGKPMIFPSTPPLTFTVRSHYKLSDR